MVLLCYFYFIFTYVVWLVIYPGQDNAFLLFETMDKRFTRVFGFLFGLPFFYI